MTTPVVNGSTPVRIHPPSTVTTTIMDTDITDAGIALSTADSPQQTDTTTPPHKTSKLHKPWPLLVIGLAAAVAVWSGWVGLGQMAGFGVFHPLPGIWDDLKLNTAVVGTALGLVDI